MICVSKKKNKNRVINYSATDWHHILWQARHWKSGWPKRIREHRYCGAYIPKATLHRRIHEFIGDIPVPDGKYCKQAYEAIENWLEAGYISLDDPIDKKIETLIICFKVNCPETTRALYKELDIVQQYRASR